jgi:sec-independent protein translocase protein TatA
LRVLDFSPVQILIVLAIALIVFGPKRLPEMGRSIGRGIREFKSSIDMDGPAPRSTPPAPAAPIDVEASSPAAAPRPSVDDEVLEGMVVPGDEQPGR